jgi:hypothetical protein
MLCRISNFFFSGLGGLTSIWDDAVATGAAATFAPITLIAVSLAAIVSLLI